jgi:hypothetical protein
MATRKPKRPTRRRPPEPPEGARGRSDDGDAFIPDPSEGGPPVAVDDIAETLAEEFVQSATSGEEAGEDVRDEWVPEEVGGPFVETRADDEFADDEDASNPPETQPEPFPTANRGT